MSEGSRHFERQSSVFDALHKIAKRLDAIEVPYAIVGGMALFQHGFRRFTEDVDILVTREGLKKIHTQLSGLGYLPPHRQSKHLRDTDLGIRIEFLTTGDYPGDGKKKPVAFPDPGTASFDADGIKYVTLPTLIELKIASGMTNSGRLKDLADVIELIKVLDLPQSFSEKLNPFVRNQFLDLWSRTRKRYIARWPSSKLPSAGQDLETAIAILRGFSSDPDMIQSVELLEAMQRDGVILERRGERGDGIATLVTTDPAIAAKYDMVDEQDFWGEESEFQ